jgi:Sugar kinases, ribokinase family
MKYIACGQASIDRITRPDGTVVGPYLGGPGVFGYTGMRLWDDDTTGILNIAADFFEYYGDWVEKNNVSTKAYNMVYDKTHVTNLIYRENGDYESVFKEEQKWLNRIFEYAWTNVRIEQVEQFSKECKALYIFVEPMYKHFWKRLKEMSDQYGFEVMWELGILTNNGCDEQFVLDCLDILKPEMASLNHNESCYFFGTEDIDEIFERIYDLDIPYFFYRAGSKGSYSIFNRKSYFVPCIDIDGLPYADATGCGNTSTAAATYAWANTKNPVMTAIMANIAAGYNVGYRGIIDILSKERREEAQQLAIKYYDDYCKQNPRYVSEGYCASGNEILFGKKQKQ